MTSQGKLHRLSAFAETPSGGNPAGVWVGDTLPDPADMQQIAADVGFSETAFVAPAEGSHRTVRYFSPEAEVTFCGHATIATGAVLGSHGPETVYKLSTAIGEVPISVSRKNGQVRVSLTSVDTKNRKPSGEFLDEALAILGWDTSDFDSSIPPAVAYAGAWHLVLAASAPDRLDTLNYDFEKLKSLMLKKNLTTIQLVRRESESVFRSRNPFPVGGVVEDPATGAAAAALGGYLRDAGLVETPFNFEIRQGTEMGRPSLLTVEVPASGGIVVSGAAVPL